MNYLRSTIRWAGVGLLVAIMAIEVVMMAIPLISAPAPAPTSSNCLGTVAGVQRELDCRNTAAEWQIVGLVDRVSTPFDPSKICAAWPKAEYAIWREYSWSEIGTAASGLGKVFCVVRQ